MLNLIADLSSDFLNLTALEAAFLLVQQRLQNFALDTEFTQKMALAFGEDFNGETWLNLDSGLLPVQVLTRDELNGANGAFSSTTNRIYLAREFLQANEIEAIARLLLEEIGHKIDSLVNDVDSAGDEGAIFAALVLGESLSDVELEQLKAEDDQGVINANGVDIAVEQQNFTGTAGNDTIVGTSGDDVINGLGGNDSLSGLEGNDTINSGLGYDTVNGGEGNDLLIIDYSSYTSFYPTTSESWRWGGPSGLYTSIQQNGGSHSGSFLMRVDPWSSDQVQFSNIERFNVTGSRTNDSIRTGNNDDTINGHGGNDLIYGGGGNDVIEGGAGNDNINGEDGNDTINGGDGNDIINGGNGSDIINGGLGDDYITQGLGVNQIDGGAGLDTLVDADFSSLTGDRIYKDDGTTYPLITLVDSTQIQNIEYFINFKTGNGNDTINFTLDVGNIIDTGAGNDVINSGLGYDTVNGGEGNDLLIIDYSSYTSFYPTDSESWRWGGPSGLYTSIQQNGGSHSGSFLMRVDPWSSDQVQFSDIERFNVTGSRTNDSIRTGNNDDTINGHLGNDLIYGGGGNDVIEGGAGNDNINGEDGNDTINGGDGNDIINGGNGSDIINGGLGDDYITQGLGVNQIDGGAGLDTLVDADFSSLTGDRIYKDDGTTYPLITLVDSTQIQNIEYFINFKTGNGNDTINFTLDVGNIIDTGAGNDVINSGLGYDTVNGGEGNDLLIIDYSSYTSFYPTDSESWRWGGPSGLYTSIQQNGGSHSGSFLMRVDPWSSDQVQFSNIERFNVTGSRTNDSIRTGNNDDTINGHGGNDLIYGGGGNDFIEGGAGNDNINGEDGNDTINGGDGNDIINGGNGSDIINGGLGDDYITQGLGVNQIDGGAGLDTLVDADFSSLTGDRIYKDDGTTYPLITLADFTQIQNIEYFINFKTGNSNDTINFSLDVGNIIDTGAGNDVINSGLGYDTVNGGEGNDLLIIDYSSYTSFYPTTSESWRWGGPSGLYTSIQQNGGSHSGSFLMRVDPWSSDQVQFSDIERFNVTGSRTNDSITTGNNNDTINGAGGIDTINAGGGADKIILADAIKQYYDDLNTATAGTTDYANIIGFETQDIIQLAGNPTLYRLNVVSGSTGLYLDKPGSEPDELIGLIRGITNLSLTSDNFVYVQPVNLSVSTTTGTEVGTTLITVTATTLSPVLRNQSVDLTVSGTVTSADYTLSSNTIIIPNGSNTGTVNFTVVNDTLIEPTETATLTISNPSSGLVLGSTTSQNITLINDDFPFVNLSVSTNAATEAGTTVVTVTATASSPVLSAQNVNLTVTGTGITTGDYTLSSSIINIPNGGTTGTRTFTIVNDTLVEGPETATIAISSISSGLLLGSTTSQTVTITDNDFPRVNLSVSTNTGSEAGTTIVTVTASASDPVIGNQTVDLAITGTGITSEDYNLSNSTITFLNGQTTGAVTFTVVNDTLIEPTETATLTISNPSSGLVLGSTTSQNITLINDDFPFVNLSVSTNAATEAGTTVVTVTATASSPVLSAQTVNLTVTGTGITTGDYTLSSSIINIPNGGTTGTRTFTIVNDTLVEGTETATIAISSISSGLLLGSTTSQTVTITDNDFPRVNLSVSTNTGSEAGTTIVTVTASASDPVIGNQTVDLAITGTGITPNDYDLSNSTITFLNGQTTGTVTFTVINDDLIEGTETAILTLTNPSSGLVLGSTTSQNIILTDNDFPSVNLSVSSNSGSEAGTTIVTVTATASSIVLGNQTIGVEIAGTGITTEDYSLSNSIITIPNGQTTGTITFTIVDDALVEGTETATLTLTNPSSGLVLGSTISQNIILTDNDFAPPVDGNFDGIPDNQQDNVVSIQAPNNEYVTFTAPQGQPSANVQAISNPDPATAPPNVDFPLGFFDFSIPQVPLGSSTTLTLFLPQGTTANSYWKYGATPDNTIPHWYNFTFDLLTNTGATFQDINNDGQSEIILNFVDGQRGDDDLTANGQISDPGAPAFVPNSSPTAVDDTTITDEDTPITINVLANDSNTQANPLTLSLATPPTQGTATLNGDDTFTYTPNPNFNGTDTFTYNLSDGTETTTATVTVTVRPVDDLPVVQNAIAPVTVSEDAANTLIDLTNVFSDVDGDAIIKSLFANTNPGLVTATVVNNQLTLDYLDNQFGTANITLRGNSNGQFIDNSFTLTVNAVNDAPTLNKPIKPQILITNTAFSFPIPPDTFADVDAGDTLSYAINNSIFGIAGSTIIGTPTVAGANTVTLIATDSQGLYASAQIQLNIFNPVTGATNGDNTLTGTNTDDLIDARDGRDNVTGGKGNDRIVGGSGADVLGGGEGRDTFVYNSIRDSGDRITDFDINQDYLDFSSLLNSFNYTGSNPVTDGYVLWGTLGTGTLISVDSDGTAGRGVARPFITLDGVISSSLSINNFVF